MIFFQKSISTLLFSRSLTNGLNGVLQKKLADITDGVSIRRGNVQQQAQKGIFRTFGMLMSGFITTKEQ